MGDVTLDAYLFFEGNCREAMEFYKGIFGGELEMQTFDEIPGDPQADMAGKIMHAKLEGGDIKLMASDTSQKELGSGKIELALGGIEEDRLRVIFGSLSSDGSIKMPLKKEFWGDTFGSLTDKYGVDWMVNITTPKVAGEEAT